MIAELLESFKANQDMDYRTWRAQQLALFKDDPIATEFLLNWKPKIAIYCGSFNPFHLGHLNILEKAEKIFDKVIICVGKNPEKKDIRIFELPQKIKNRQIVYYSGLLTELMVDLKYDVTLVRGLRNSTDLQYELTQFKFLQDLRPDIKIVNIFCDKEFEHISSSAIRGLLNFGEGDRYLPK